MKKLKVLTPSSPALPAAERREGERSETERSAATGNADIMVPATPLPNPEVVARAKRRRFTAAYKESILEEADQASQPGDIGALLRREGLFSSHLTTWRRERKAGVLQALTPRQRGPKSKRNPLAEETIHADRGSSMTSKPVAFLLADLGITKTHSRPHVSDDNPYSESQFRTLKYRPEFPDRFGSLQHSRAFGQQFFLWYNHQHRHSGLGLLTPTVVHYGQAPQVRAQRQAVLDAAYAAHPERFVNHPPKPLPLPTEVWINKPQNSENKTH